METDAFIETTFHLNNGKVVTLVQLIIPWDEVLLQIDIVKYFVC